MCVCVRSDAYTYPACVLFCLCVCLRCNVARVRVTECVRRGLVRLRVCAALTPHLRGGISGVPLQQIRAIHSMPGGSRRDRRARLKCCAVEEAGERETREGRIDKTRCEPSSTDKRAGERERKKGREAVRRGEDEGGRCPGRGISERSESERQMSRMREAGREER